MNKLNINKLRFFKVIFYLCFIVYLYVICSLSKLEKFFHLNTAAKENHAKEQPYKEYIWVWFIKD